MYEIIPSLFWLVQTTLFVKDYSLNKWSTKSDNPFRDKKDNLGTISVKEKYFKRCVCQKIIYITLNS